MDLPDGDRTIPETFEYIIKYYNTPLIINLVTECIPTSTTGLHKACIVGSVPLVVRMLENGVAVDAQDDEGTRALDLAARYLHPELRNGSYITALTRAMNTCDLVAL